MSRSKRSPAVVLTHHRKSFFGNQFLLFLGVSEACRNESLRNTRLRWSRPGIAGEPNVPAPAAMRAHRTWWTKGRGKARRLVRKRKELDILPAKVGSSSCGEVLARLHRPSGSVR